MINPSMIHRRMVVFLIVICIVSLRYAYSFSGYLQAEVIAALDKRDAFFSAMKLPPSIDLSSLSSQKELHAALQKNLQNYHGEATVWYYFLHGVATIGTSKDNAAESFSKALGMASAVPADLWVLFTEFDMLNQSPWAQQTLGYLEKSFIRNGVTHSNMLSQLMLLRNHQTSSTGSIQTIDYLNWAQLFDPGSIAPSLYRLFHKQTDAKSTIFSQIKTASLLLWNSWHLQLETLNLLYQWFRIIAILFIFLVILFLSIDKLPTALHRASDIFPLSVPAFVRKFLTLFIFLSILNFGVVPFLLVVIVLLWRKTYYIKRKLLLVTLALVLGSPLDCRITEAFRQTLSEDQPLQLLRRSMTEAWYPALENDIMTVYAKNTTNKTTLLAAALLYWKKNDLAKASSFINRLQPMNSRDPVIYVVAGNIFRELSDNVMAKNIYEKCIAEFPSSEYAYFNLSQLLLATLQPSQASILLEKSSQLGKEFISEFLVKNEQLFSTSWPRLRQVMVPDYSPSFFWSNLFLQNSGSWKNANIMFRPRFLGLTIPIFYLLAAILIIGIMWQSGKTNSIEKVFYCRYCGVSMCHKCRKGVICPSCHNRLASLSNKEMSVSVSNQIIRKRHFNSTIQFHVFNAIIPGSGTLFCSEKTHAHHLILFIVSIVCFSLVLYAWILQESWAILVPHYCMFVVFGIVACYNLFFFTVSLRKAIREFRLYTGGK
ncbi:MAG: hypothetical protein JW795_04210 [Chitinivibrionales bacterium]|nr:hypothetical protein [Chitinivibrionales bacterium]